ncbi:MAG: DUF86 domain-containing protein [Candidatus Hodarchaeota archaeon]
MSSRSLKLFFNDIRNSIDKIKNYIGVMTFTQFKTDQKTIDAVIRNLEIIGEAVKNIPDDITKNYTDVDWRGATAMRDRLIHGYFGVDISIVWETIKNDLPELKKQVDRIWNEIN